MLASMDLTLFAQVEYGTTLFKIETYVPKVLEPTMLKHSWTIVLKCGRTTMLKRGRISSLFNFYVHIMNGKDYVFVKVFPNGMS